MVALSQQNMQSHQNIFRKYKRYHKTQLDQDFVPDKYHLNKCTIMIIRMRKNN